MSDPGLFLDLAKVLGLLCTAFTGLIVARAAIEQRSQIAWDLTAGAVLGAAAVLAMSLPTVVAPGIIVDPRAAILVWAAPVGGWPAALVAAAVAVGYRLPMGGPGAIGGIFIIVASITLGAVLARYLRRRGAVLGPEHVALVTIGLLVVSVAGYLLIRPLDVGIATMLRTLPANGTMTVVGTLVLGGLIVIDERRRALLRRSRALEAEARDLAAARADFVADLGHEVRGPLSALQGFAQRLGAGPLDADQRRALGGVRVAVDQLARLMDDVLDSAKGEAGTLNLVRAPLDPAETVRQAAAMVEAEAAGKGLTLTVAIASDVPGAVAGDALRLRQIALNLISNAVKFTDRGSVTVRLAPWRRPRDGAPGLRLSVADTGIGIAATELDRVFDRFGRAGTASRGDRPGTGLGLGIARSLARAMGGDLRLDSAPGRGTTATADVALPPTAASVAMPAPAAAPQTGAAPAPAVAPPAPAGRRVLVAEDTAMNREVLALLRGDGHQVVEVADGVAAVAAAEAGPIDVIVMDLRMPGLDGVAATRRIRAFDPATPILILTGDVRPDTATAARAAGADAVLVKPFDPADLSAAVAGATRRAAAAEPAGDPPQPIAGARTPPAGPATVRSLAEALGAERAAALVADACADTLARLDRIDAAVARGDDLATVRGPAHALIGPAGIAAGDPAASAARALEDAAGAGDRGDATAQAAILRGLVEATRSPNRAVPRDEGGGESGSDRTPQAAGGAVP